MDPAVLSRYMDRILPFTGYEIYPLFPDADVIIVEGERKRVVRKIQDLVEEYKKGLKVGVMAVHETASFLMRIVSCP